ncbi:hypothetical protein PC119_g7709 [Phytophthora cactorum]|nr:hypothetical protein PC119_g7709 [Phytophthora cactorum]
MACRRSTDQGGVSKEIRFPDLGSYQKYRCVGDCFRDCRDDVEAAIYCSASCCNLGAHCSNAPIIRTTLKLFDTGRVGLWELSEWDATANGQPGQDLIQNSGYKLLYNAKPTKTKYVYAEALNRGSITRFISHACDPNAPFVEMQNRRKVTLLIKMIEDVKAGAKISVDYDNERWFVCSCDDCWKGGADKSTSE